MPKETVEDGMLVATIFLIAIIAVGLVALASAIASCRWGGAKIQADVPIYGNALIDVAPVEIDGAPAPDAPQ